VTLGARLGIAAAAVLLIVLASGFWYLWKYPLSVYALMNNRALAGAGLAQAAVPCSIGPQNVWTAGPARRSCCFTAPATRPAPGRAS